MGAGLKVPAISAAGFGLAVLTIVLGFFVAAAQARGAAPAAEAAARDRRLPVEPGASSTARGRRPSRRRPSCSSSPSRCCRLRLGFSDESNFADDTTTKQAYDLIVDGFGEGSTGPIFLVAEVDGAGSASARSARASTTPVASRSATWPPSSARSPTTRPHPTAVRWLVTPKGGPQDEATTQLVNRLRHDVLPSIEQATGTDVLVTGLVAANVDMSHYMGNRMPLFFGAVLALSFLLLMVVFRSLLVPLKAVIMNLLSIGAAYGVIVALFQWGWLSDLTGVQPGPIETWMPMMLFAIVFGLSMDYEVFLLSRVREEWHRTGDSRTSVADGLAATAKVITAAAAIMVVVFGSFMLEFERTMKMMGTGLAVAILFDATIVRMLLVPATMELLGDRNWWLPGWLDRLLPNLDVEGHFDDAVSLDDEQDSEREAALTD